MRLLLYSPAFLPDVGGLEIAVATMAGEFHRAGHEVVVVCQVASPKPDDFPYRVVRRPGARELLRWTRWCDIYCQFNVSLRGLWPLLLVRRPWAVSHHSWYRQPDGRVAWQDRLKRYLLRFAASSISVSQAIADDLGTPSVVIGNAYRDDLFRRIPPPPEAERDRELVFVGRLVSDKGVDILLDAMALLAREGLALRLAIAGDGPEMTRLRGQAARLGIGSRVGFLGTRTGEDLVQLLNRHRVLVVPSRYNEPFGIVALEGIACGCAVIGSEGGGLKDAIGPCGRTFSNGDPVDLARVLREVFEDPETPAQFQRQAPEHLAAHTSAGVAAEYLAELENALTARGDTRSSGPATREARG
ncbi:MAG TPA: glycosyltransferase family 4 protein [Thermoanaerobaculia bacterium]|nr:glycosyltransferase family 4 protein [Thermoanaerobaculia bacterium]